MIAPTGKACPLSPSGSHRVYYSARNSRGTAPVGRVACCRHCAVDVYLVAGQWQSCPPGEILIGMCLEVDRIIIEGTSTREPIGIFGPGGSAAPRHEFTIVPPMPRIPS